MSFPRAFRVHFFRPVCGDIAVTIILLLLLSTPLLWAPAFRWISRRFLSVLFLQNTKYAATSVTFQCGMYIAEFTISCVLLAVLMSNSNIYLLCVKVHARNNATSVVCGTFRLEGNLHLLYVSANGWRRRSCKICLCSLMICRTREED